MINDSLSFKSSISLYNINVKRISLEPQLQHRLLPLSTHLTLLLSQSSQRFSQQFMAHAYLTLIYIICVACKVYLFAQIHSFYYFFGFFNKDSGMFQCVWSLELSFAWYQNGQNNSECEPKIVRFFNFYLSDSSRTKLGDPFDLLKTIKKQKIDTVRAIFLRLFIIKFRLRHPSPYVYPLLYNRDSLLSKIMALLESLPYLWADNFALICIKISLVPYNWFLSAKQARQLGDS